MVLVDGLQVVLDVAGIVPFFGMAPDAINTVIHVARGNWVDAGMSAIAIIPIYGDAIKATYIAGKGAKAANTAMKGAKATTEVLSHLDEMRDVGKVAAGAADEAADLAKAASDVPNPHCKPDSAN